VKLYRVRATLDVLVMAEDAFAAEHLASRYATNELRIHAVEATQSDMPAGWEPRTLIYQQKHDAADMTAADALKGCKP